MSEPRKEVLAEGVTLWLGDCRDVMASWPPCFRVDGVVTDPPFGIGFKYESHDDSADLYPALIEPVLSHCDRLVDDGPFFFWQAINTASEWHKWFPPGYRLLASCKNFTQFRPISIQYGFDPIIYWRKGKDHAGVAGVRDWHIADTASAVAGEKFGHPCPRPLDAVQWIIQAGTLSADTILDPFMGSGTTGVGCVNLSRRFIGIEIEPKYFDIACRRISDALKRPRLPFEEPRKIEQGMLNL